MEYRELAAPPESPIDRIWCARGEGGPRETILPDGRYEIIFNLGDVVLQDGAPQPRALLAAEPRRAVTIAPAGRVEFIGIGLRDGRAAAAIGAPLREVRDRMLDLRDLHGGRADALHTRLGELATFEERAALLLAVFGTASPDPLAEHAARAIRSRGGRVSISRLASACGVTVRTLARAFERSIGITPKTLARVQRINCAAAALRDGVDASTAALDAGFFDQPHLVNEFRSLAGLSPSRWLDLPPGLGVQFLQDGSGARG